MIGAEVSGALTRYLNYGSSIGAVNFPEVDLRAITAEDDKHIRVCYVHRNEPGTLRAINEVRPIPCSIVPITLASSTDPLVSTPRNCRSSPTTTSRNSSRTRKATRPTSWPTLPTSPRKRSRPSTRPSRRQKPTSSPDFFVRLFCSLFGFLGLCSTIEHFADRFFSLARVPLQIKHGLLRRAEDDMTLFSFYPAFADPSGCMRA